MVCKKCRRDIPDDAALCCYCGKVYIRKTKRAKRRPAGTGSIRKLTDTRRRNPYRVEKNGVRLGDFPSMEAAQLFLDKINAKPRLADAINMTLDDIHKVWLEREYPRLTAKGQASYDSIWPKFEGIKDLRMRDIRTDTVQTLVDLEIEKGRSRSQQEKIRSMYSLLCQVAMELDIIDRNYATFLLLSKQEKIQRDVFTEKEILAVLEDAAACETSKIIAIFLFTGFRISELFEMPLESVDTAHWTFRGGEKTDAGMDRLVPIVAQIRPFVQYFCDRATGSMFLSGYEGNQKSSNFRKRDYYPTLERLGIRTEERKMKPHSCRYTLATRGHSLGIDDDTLRKILGHADYDVTSTIYIQGDLNKLHTEMAKVNLKRPRNDQSKKSEKSKKPQSR